MGIGFFCVPCNVLGCGSGPTHPRKNEKWATFTFISPNIRKVTNLFKQAGVKIAFRGKNTLARLVKTTSTTRTPPHNKPGIYQLKCNTCNLSYIGQTSRNLKTHYHEHIRYIKNNNPQSTYAQHIVNNSEHNDPPETSPQPTFTNNK